MAPRSIEMPGARTAVEPGAIQLMMLGGRTEIPEYRLVILRQKREAVGLVLRPGADVRRGDVAHVVHVETKQRSHGGFLQQIFRFLQTFAPQTVEVDPVLPVDGHRSVSFESHKYLLRRDVACNVLPAASRTHAFTDAAGRDAASYVSTTVYTFGARLGSPFLPWARSHLPAAAKTGSAHASRPCA